MESGERVRHCPRCGARWREGSAEAVPTGFGGCSACGLELPASALAELDYLTDLEGWARAKRQWILDTAAAGGVVGSPASGSMGQVGAHPAHVQQPARTPSAAGCLLATGVFALVAAGLTFTAFAWSFLGAFGQLMVLVIAGVAAMVGGHLATRRIPGTANALSVTGVLLLVVASGFLLDADSLGSPWFRAFGVVMAAVGGIAVSYRQARRQPAVAVVTASSFAVLALVAAATAPWLDGADGAPSWSGWWVAGVFVVWGASLLVLDAQQRGPWRRMPWSWFGTLGLVVGVCVVAAVAGDRLDAARRFLDAPLVTSSLIVLVGAAVLLVVDRLARARWWALPVGSMLLIGVAAVLVMSSVDDPSSRRYAAIPAALLAMLLIAAAAHLTARPSFPRERNAPDDRLAEAAAPAADTGQAVVQRWAGVLIRLSMVAAGGTVALLLSPTIDPPLSFVDCAYPPCIDPSFVEWAGDSYSWWRGVAVAVAAILVAVVVGLLVRRARSTAWSTAPVLIGVSTLVWWSWVVVTDLSGGSSGPDAARSAVTAALLIGGLGLLVAFASMRESPAALWVAAGIAAAGGQVAWTWLELADWPIGPELHSLFIAVPLLLAGMVVLLQHPHHQVSTWVSVGPAIVAALVFPVAAVLDETTSRWFEGADPPTAAVVRIVALLLVGAVLAVVGARAHWSAVFWPGLVTVVLVAGAQVVDAASSLPQWLSLGVVGVVLLVAGARWESVRLRGRRTRQWAGTLR